MLEQDELVDCKRSGGDETNIEDSHNWGWNMLEPTKVAVQPKYNRKILVKESNPENFMV